MSYSHIIPCICIRPCNYLYYVLLHINILFLLYISYIQTPKPITEAQLLGLKPKTSQPKSITPTQPKAQFIFYTINLWPKSFHCQPKLNSKQLTHKP